MNIVSSTIRDIIVKSEKKYGSWDAFRFKAKSEDEEGKKTVVLSKTYTQLKQDSEKFSSALDFLGEKNSHIAILGTTSYEWVVSYLGTVNGGNVAVPLDAQLTNDDICELLVRADVTTLVYDESKKETAKQAALKCPGLRHLIAMNLEEDMDGQKAFWKLVNSQKAGYDYQPDPESLATIMFTSGTTGKSKGVMLTHRNLAENATCLDMKMDEGTVIMSVLPIHHAYCLSMDILKGLSIGSVICINDSLMRIARNIKLFEPNMILMVPLMIETLAKKLESAALLPAPIIKAKVFGKQFQTICSGGAYMNPAYIDTFKKYGITILQGYGITILQGYGMTECSPVISTNLPWNSKKGSVGKLMPNCEAKTVDEELWVKGSSVMQGYYKMPEETKETISDGWLKTGDLGYVDEDGFVFLTGRKKNLIITPNGENVSPEEIENKLSEKRIIAEVLVRESEGVIEAEIFPDYEYAAKKRVKDLRNTLQEIIDEYNINAPLYKRVVKLKIRETEFEKNTTKKIKRF